MITQKWIDRYVALARHVAEWSKDPSTKVGAVAVGRDPREIALGYNGFPRGVVDSEERLNDRPVKYQLVQHAERNVLDNARFDLQGATLVVTQYPCAECAKSIVSKGIALVITPPPPIREPWAESAKWAKVLMEEGGVEVHEYVLS
jgi:dCMP deaminase